MWRAVQEELTRRWFSADRLTVERAVQAHPDLAADPPALAQLILSELALRTAGGEHPQLADYAARFPQCADWLGGERAAQVGAAPDDSRSIVQDGTVVAAPGDLPSVVMKPPATTADLAAAPPPPAADPPMPAGRLADHFADLPVEQGTVVAALPAGFRSAPRPAADAAAAPSDAAAPVESYETVQSQLDVKSVTSIIERISAPSLKIPGYQLLGELGRGGMGVVYRARQLSADRIVALKVIRNDVLETLPDDTRSSTIERFRHEAQAAAKIEHDHLVSVYEVGESEGLKYYAMRFVEGKSLYELLRDGPLDNRRAATYLEPVCRAIHAIHEHGVLHRDIKPHNIMIDRRGDRPLVTDFGLAKFVGGQDELTHAGTVMGTPSYMSPEQAVDSAKVTALADVYSLGATLYHSLTGRAPFQAAHIADTLRQIMRDDPIPPRKLNSAIDRDLETICLKSLLKESEKRYASAADLADDLARYLRGEPILARPLGPVARAWRWCRRNQLVASLISTAIALAVIALVAVGVGYYNTTQALAESKRSLRNALNVVNEFCTSVAEDDLKNLPGFQPLRRDLLLRAQEYYDAFIKEGHDDPLLRDELGRAHFRMGVIQDELGDRQAAVSLAEQARDAQQAQLALAPQDKSRRQALGDTLNFLGTRYQKLKRFPDAATTLQQAQEIRTHLADEYPDNADYQRVVANTIMNRGLLDWELGITRREVAQFVSARGYFNEAQQRRQNALARAGDKRTAIERDLAMGYYGLARISFSEWEFLRESESATTDAAAMEELRLAMEDSFANAQRRLQQLLDDHRELQDRFNLAACLRLQGDARFQQLRDAESLQSYAAARQHIEELARENPKVPSYAMEEFEVLLSIAKVYQKQQKNEEARAECLRARDVVDKLRTLAPDHPFLPDLDSDVKNLLAALPPDSP